MALREGTDLGLCLLLCHIACQDKGEMPNPKNMQDSKKQWDHVHPGRDHHDKHDQGLEQEERRDWRSTMIFRLPDHSE